MREPVIGLKSINQLLVNQSRNTATYWIPAYQRGYRWTRLQVIQLLDDIWRFIKDENSGQFYCLQPLVIKALDDGRYEVVDGQQRLTTIYIVLTYLRDLLKLLKKTRFALRYETRGDLNKPFLADIDLSLADQNIDFSHICEAYKAVEAWFEKNAPDSMEQLKFLQHLLNDDGTGRNVRVIWFELIPEDDPVSAFTRLNVGKIPLTNDELIRALFLRRKSEKTNEENRRQIQTANEWDQIEKGLQRAEFWYFFSNDRNRPLNRIGFLFELIAYSEGLSPGSAEDHYAVFHFFNDKLEKSEMDREWRAIEEEFRRLEEWFQDPELFHLIGFLIARQRDLAAQRTELIEIRNLSRTLCRAEFKSALRRRIFSKTVGGVLPSAPAWADVHPKVGAHLEALEYLPGRPNEGIRSILLLFNIATLLQNRKSNIRFDFENFKDCAKWDIEHIRSVTWNEPEKPKDRIEWLEHVYAHLLSVNAAPELQQEIIDFCALPQDAAAEPAFQSVYGNALLYFQEDKDQDTPNGISNLALLDARTNRSYKNSPFAVKRARILEIDQAGVFVPLCTRNVFLKCYSAQNDNLMFWTDQDQTDYRNAITDTLTALFIGKQEEKE